MCLRVSDRATRFSASMKLSQRLLSLASVFLAVLVKL
jgi:hypothetical protein